MPDLGNVLVRPVVSEKTYGLMEQNVYVFIVHPHANKLEIRRAVEEAFGVKVDNVNTLNRRGKSTRNRRTNVPGRRADTKRAFVTLHSGDKIDLFES